MLFIFVLSQNYRIFYVTIFNVCDDKICNVHNLFTKTINFFIFFYFLCIIHVSFSTINTTFFNIPYVS